MPRVARAWPFCLGTYLSNRLVSDESLRDQSRCRSSNLGSSDRIGTVPLILLESFCSNTVLRLDLPVRVADPLEERPGDAGPLPVEGPSAEPLLALQGGSPLVPLAPLSGRSERMSNHDRIRHRFDQLIGRERGRPKPDRHRRLGFPA